MFEYHKIKSREQQITEAKRIREKYPDRIPVIAEVFSSEIPKLDKNKYLVPSDLTIGQFMYVIRKRIKLSPEKGLYMFINKKIFSTNKLIKDIYETEHENYFLFIAIYSENTFG